MTADVSGWAKAVNKSPARRHLAADCRDMAAIRTKRLTICSLFVLVGRIAVE
jgi:hypothetical protein